MEVDYEVGDSNKEEEVRDHLEREGPPSTSGSEKETKKKENLEVGMEDLIQKILEKYGEVDEHSKNESKETSRATEIKDSGASPGTEKTYVSDDLISDMIRRETTKWDKVYGKEYSSPVSGTHRSFTERKDQKWQDEISRRNESSDDRTDINRVIRSQTGVAKQLISVCEGLDEVSFDLEEMKRELKRVQMKAYECQRSAGTLENVDSTENSEEFTWESNGKPITEAVKKDIRQSGSFGLRNEWIQEREGIIRISKENDLCDDDKLWMVRLSSPSYLTSPGRTHIKERDVEVTNLLTIAEPLWQTQPRGDASLANREPKIDRFGRPVYSSSSFGQQKSTEQDDAERRSRAHGSKSVERDGYCYMCGEFGDCDDDWSGRPRDRYNLKNVFQSSVHQDYSDKIHKCTHEAGEPSLFRSTSYTHLNSEGTRTYPSDHRSSGLKSVSHGLYPQDKSPILPSYRLPQIHRPVSSTSTDVPYQSKFLQDLRRRRRSIGVPRETTYRGQYARIY